MKYELGQIAFEINWTFIKNVQMMSILKENKMRHLLWFTFEASHPTFVCMAICMYTFGNFWSEHSNPEFCIPTICKK